MYDRRDLPNSHYEKFTLTGEIKCIDDEIPFDLPKGWEWCRIKDICQMQAGKNISASEISEEKNLEYQYRCIGGNGLRGYVKTYNTEGHFSIVGRQGVLCGCLNIEVGRFYATEHAVIVDSWGIITPLFMYYILTALNLNQYSTATAQPGLSVAKIIDTPFPLPPLAEQQRIVAKIEELMLLVEQYGRAQSELEALNSNIREQLKKSVLQYAIEGKLEPQCEEDGTAEDLLREIQAEKQRLYAEGKIKKKDLAHSTIFRGEDNKYFEKKGNDIICIDEEIPFKIPESWKWVRHNQLFEVSGGSQPPKSYFIDTPQNGYIRLFQIRDYGDNPVPIYVPVDKVSKFTDKRDILLARYGGSIGKIFWAEKGAYNVAMAKVIPLYASEAINKEYVFLFYHTNLYQGPIKEHSRSAQAGFNRGDLEKLLFPLPPYKEQVRIVEQYKALVNIMSR